MALIFASWPLTWQWLLLNNKFTRKHLSYHSSYNCCITSSSKWFWSYIYKHTDSLNSSIVDFDKTDANVIIYPYWTSDVFQNLLSPPPWVRYCSKIPHPTHMRSPHHSHPGEHLKTKCLIIRGQYVKTPNQCTRSTQIFSNSLQTSSNKLEQSKSFNYQTAWISKECKEFE